MVVEKTMKAYGTKPKRLRIDFKKADGFNPEDKVVILKKEEYDFIRKTMINLQINLKELENQLEMLEGYRDIDSVLEKTINKTLKANGLV